MMADGGGVGWVSITIVLDGNGNGNQSDNLYLQQIHNIKFY
jgi:hypothetical protein